MDEFLINLSDLSEAELAALWWMVNSADEKAQIMDALTGWFYGNTAKAHAYIGEHAPARIYRDLRK